MHSLFELCILAFTLYSKNVYAIPVLSASTDDAESDISSPLASRVAFNVAIVDHLGNDASSNFTVHRRSLSDSLSQEGLQKRDRSRPMLHCRSPDHEARYSLCSDRPGGSSVRTTRSFFIRCSTVSECLFMWGELKCFPSHTAAQTVSLAIIMLTRKYPQNGVTVVCRPPIGSHYFKPDSCYPHEICIQGIAATGQRQWTNMPTAYCVSTQNFVDLAMDAESHKTTPQAVDMSVPATVADGLHLAEAVVTNADGRILSKGASIHMAPQKKQMLHDVQVWRTVGKDLDCVDCARLHMPVVPVGTERIDVKIGLHAGASTGKLWVVGL